MGEEQQIQFTLNVTEDGLVMLDFGQMHIDHLTLTDEQALVLAEGLVETARMATAGRADILRVASMGRSKT